MQVTALTLTLLVLCDQVGVVRHRVWNEGINAVVGTIKHFPWFSDGKSLIWGEIDEDEDFQGVIAGLLGNSGLIRIKCYGARA